MSELRTEIDDIIRMLKANLFWTCIIFAATITHFSRSEVDLIRVLRDAVLINILFR